MRGSPFWLQGNFCNTTFGRIVAEETGSMVATQDALDHANLSTTTVYVQRISAKRDLHSAAVAWRRKGRDEV